MDRVRRKTKPQADEQMVSSQGGFLGGMNLDIPPSEIQGTEVVYLENYIPHRTHLETRPGCRTYADIPGTGTIFQIYYHSLTGNIVVHRQNNIFVLTPDGDWLTAVTLTQGGTISATPSQMDSLRGGVIIFQDSFLTFLEFPEGSNPGFRPLQQVTPSEGPEEVFLLPTSAGDYTYRFIWTFARYVGGIKVAESAPREFSKSRPDYFELSFSEPYGSRTADVLRINSAFSIPAGYMWNRVLLYRTADLGPNANASTLPEQYRLSAVLDPALVVYYGLGDMAIEGTPPFQVYSSEDLSAAEDEVWENQDLLRTRFMAPLPAGRIGRVTPGFIFCAAAGDKKICYSEIGQLGGFARVGLYNPGLQYMEVPDAVFGLRTTPDTIIALCRTALYRGTVYSSQNVGSAETGEVISVFGENTISLFDESVGVLDASSASATANGGFIARCTDGSIRLFDGLSWVRDLSRRKVSRELRLALDGACSVYDPTTGAYLIWYRKSDDSPNLDRTLRLGTSEEGGIGWCFYTGANWPQPYPGCRGITVVDDNGNRLLLVADNVNGRLVWVESYDGVDLDAAYGLDFEGEDDEAIIESNVLLREFTAATERNWSRHLQSFVWARPIPGQTLDSDFTIAVRVYSDGGIVPDAEIVGVQTSERVSFREEVGGRRLQIGIKASGSAHCISGVETVFQSLDKKSLASTPVRISEEEEICSGLTLWLNRRKPWENSANPAEADSSELGYELDEGPDEIAETAIRSVSA
jgi:hypothetical protein